MKCECVSDLVKRLSEEKDYEKAEARNLAINFTTGDTDIMIPFTYLKKKKDGSLTKNRTEISIKANYCPFCGLKQ